MKYFNAILLAIFVMAATASAAVPQQFYYQGSLSRTNGVPLDTTISLTLRLYDAPSGGTMLWSETYPSVLVRHGLFNVTMGNASPLLQSYFMDGETYLAIIVGTDPEMTPRTHFVTVPYSYQTLTVDGASAGTLTGRLVLTGSVVCDTVVTSHGIKFPDGTLQMSAASIDTTSLSNRINAKADSADHATRSWVSAQGFTADAQTFSDTNTFDATRNWVESQNYLHGFDTLSLNSRIGAKADSADNATRSWVNAQGFTSNAQTMSDTNLYDATRTWVNEHGFLISSDTLSLSSRINAKADSADHATRTWTTAEFVQKSDSTTWLVTQRMLGAKQDTASALSWPDTIDSQPIATKTWVTAHSGGGGGQAFSDTNSYDATRTWVTSQDYLPKADTLSLSNRINIKADSTDHATRTWVKSNGHLRGTGNTVSGYGFIGGGDGHYADSMYATIGGGYGNSATNHYATISGGQGSAATFEYTTVGGGSSNAATAPYAAVGGGWHNSATGQYSVIAGGGGPATEENEVSNWADGNFSAILGGEFNSATGQYSTIGGGLNNTASGNKSTIPGGESNLAAGEGSFAAGKQAMANHNGTFVWADQQDGSFASTATNQFLIRSYNGVGINTNNPAEALEVGGDVKADTFRADAGIRFPDGTFQNTAAAGSGGGQQYADTNSYDATRTWIKSHGYLRGSNTASGSYSIVSGGDNNSATDAFTAVGGGMDNIAGGDRAVVGGGEGNSASGDYSTVGGGEANVASNTDAAVNGGGYNNATGYGATVSGGGSNIASQSYAAVGGGMFNRARGLYSVVGGGGGPAITDSNSASGDASTIGGGMQNSAPGKMAVVCGGLENRADDIQSVVCGGYANLADDTLSFIGGGLDNVVAERAGAVVGGELNSAMGRYSFVGGGYDNTSNGLFAFIGGGRGNATTGTGSVVVGGGDVSYPNVANGDYAAVVSGIGNSAGQYSFVGNGIMNSAGEIAVCVGGFHTHATGLQSFVGGGQGSEASGAGAVVCGGTGNEASGLLSFVGGGGINESSRLGNQAASDFSTVCGGRLNRAWGLYSTICGGDSNFTDGTGGFVGGGRYNYAYGAFSTIPGGWGNYAEGNFSFTGGRRARAYNDGCFVWADATDADFNVSADNIFAVRANGGVYFHADATLATGVVLAHGAGAWTTYCDSTKKQNIRSVDTREILNKVVELPIKQWSYKTQDPEIEHIGPMAQDFWSQFHLGEDSLGISTIDPDGIALAAIQELAKENEQLKNDLAALRAQVQSIIAGEQKTQREEK